MKSFIVRSDIPKDPALIIKNQLLLGPGQWNGKNFTREQIKRGLSLTKWEDFGKRSIIYGHRVDGDASPDQWLGYHTIPSYKTEELDGVKDEGMYADLYFYDENLARKIAYGGARAGVSERLEFKDGYDGIQIDGFLNLSIVDNPACKQAYLNLSDEGENHVAEIMSPNYINLVDEPDEILTKTERGSSNANIEKMSDEKIKALEDNMEAMAKKIEELSKPVIPEPVVVPVEPVVKPIVEPVVKPIVEPVVIPAPVVIEPVVAEPVVMTAPVTPEPVKADNSSAVVDAIKEMGESFKTAISDIPKVANPQTVAATNPQANVSSRDGEITKKLVKQYDAMHGINNE